MKKLTLCLSLLISNLSFVSAFGAGKDLPATKSALDEKVLKFEEEFELFYGLKY